MEVLQSVAHRHGRLWAVNDRADVASLSGAPVFHIGQKDIPLRSARKLLHDSTIIGLSTHTPEEIDAAIAASPGRSGLDYFCVGPVWATPTKPGRSAVGLDLVKYAANAVKKADEETVGGVVLPWFAIGGIDLSNVQEVVQAGASRIEEHHLAVWRGGQMPAADDLRIEPRASRDVAHGDTEMGDALDRNHVALPSSLVRCSPINGAVIEG